MKVLRDPPPEFSNLADALSALRNIRCTSSRSDNSKPLNWHPQGSAWILEDPSLGKIFYKEDTQSPENFFQFEALGLQSLAEFSPKEIYIPKVFAILPQGILLEYLESEPNEESFFTKFGKSLAQLHQLSAKKALGGVPHTKSHYYGFEVNNYIGQGLQSNTPNTNWAKFFANERLIPQLEKSQKSGVLPKKYDREIENIIAKLSDLLPKNPLSCLLHGDLWAGNFLAIRKDGRQIASIFDPAVYWGHFEADLAMTELFAGYPASFYRSYNQVLPISSEYTWRKNIYNLYHILNHVNIFGYSYLSMLGSCLKAIQAQI